MTPHFPSPPTCMRRREVSVAAAQSGRRPVPSPAPHRPRAVLALRTTVVVAAALLPAWQTLASTPFYTARGINPVTTSTSMFVQDLTNSGRVVGWGENIIDSYAFATNSSLGTVLIDSCRESTYNNSCAIYSANDAGTLVGSYQGQMTVWTGGSNRVTLATYGAAAAVNGQGWVVGVGGNIDNNAANETGLLWRPGLGLTSLGNAFRPTQLNDNGVIVGSFSDQAAVWTLNPDGSSSVHTVGAGARSTIADVNESGFFVGNSGASGRSFAGLVSGESVVELALPQGYTYSHVYSINESGLSAGVVGTFDATGAHERLALWQDGAVWLPEVRGLLTEYHRNAGAPATDVPTFTNVQVNDSGWLAVTGMVSITTPSFPYDPWAYLILPCQRCGQIHPNPNPVAGLIEVRPDWEGAVNTENFANHGRIAVTGVLENSGNLVTTGAGTVSVSDFGGRLVNTGQMSFGATGNAAQISLYVGGYGSFVAGPQSAVDNAGHVVVEGGGTLALDAAVWRNRAGSQLDILEYGAFSANGIMVNESGGNISISAHGNLSQNANGSLANAGLLYVGGRLETQGRVFNNPTGRIELAGSPASMVNGRWTVTGGHVENTGHVHVSEFGELVVNQGASMHTVGGGVLAVSAGAFSNNGAVWVDGSSSLNIAAAPGHDSGFLNSGLVLNQGSVQLADLRSNPSGRVGNSGSFSVQRASIWNGEFTNYSAGIVDVGLDGGALVNNGIITLTGRGLAVHYDGNTLNMSSTPFTGAQSVMNDHSNEFVNTAGGTLVIEDGGNLFVLGHTLTNSGMVDIHTQGWLGSGPYTNAIYAQLAGSTHVNGELAVSSFSCEGGSLNGSGRITAQAQSIFGACTVNPGNSPGTLTLVGDVTFDGATLNMQVGAGATDQLVVQGHADFKSGQVVVSFLDGAMPDPDAAASFFDLSACTACTLDKLQVQVTAPQSGWQGGLAVDTASGLGRVSFSNDTALNLGDWIEGTVLAAGEVAFNTQAATVAVAAEGPGLANEGAFYNRNGATLAVWGGVVNRAGASFMNHGEITNYGVIRNEAGASVNNRGRLVNASAEPVALVNHGRFNNSADGLLRNEGSAQIVNEASGQLSNHGLIVQGANTVAGALPWFVNRGQIDNHGVIDNAASSFLNEGGRVVIHAGASITGTGDYRQTMAATPGPFAVAETVVDGVLQAPRVLLDAGTRLSGHGTVLGEVSGGVISPGAGIGNLWVEGSVSGSALEVEADATGLGLLTVNGSATLGAVSVRLASDFNPGLGQAYIWLYARGLAAPDASQISFSLQDASGNWTDAPRVASAIGDTYFSLDFGGTTLYALAELTHPGNTVFEAQGFHLVDHIAVVPEPQSWLLMAVGLAGLGLANKRRLAAHQPQT